MAAGMGGVGLGIAILLLSRSVYALHMPLVRFTQNIQRHVACPQQQVNGGSVREALLSYFNTNEAARDYVLDDQGSLRKHMAVFINGRPLQDRTTLSDAISAHDAIDVMQALSGG